MIDRSDAQQNDFEGFEFPQYTQVPNSVFHRFLLSLQPAAFKVLMALVHEIMFHNRETGDAAISQTEIQRMTGLSDRGVRLAIEQCLEAGAVEMVEKPSSKPALSAMYTLRFRPGCAPWDDHANS